MGSVQNRIGPAKGVTSFIVLPVLCVSWQQLHLLLQLASPGKVITVRIKLYGLCPAACLLRDVERRIAPVRPPCLEDSCLSNVKSILLSGKS